LEKRFDERMNQMQAMLERVLCLQLGKEPHLDAGQNSAQPNLDTRATHEKNDVEMGADRGIAGNGTGTDRETQKLHRTPSEDTFCINKEEYNWGRGFIRDVERR
jgi:hypothetical protein